MRELLSDKGSIYIHCDWHCGHYIKVLCDEIFGRENFRNEIVWRRGRILGMRLCGVEAMGLGIQVVLNFLEIAIRFTIIQKVKILYFIDNLSLILVQQ